MTGGINVDPLNAAGRPDPALLRQLGFTAVRLVLRPGCADYVAICSSVGLPVLGVVARESEAPEQYAGWPLSWVQVGNEMDSPGASSWRMTPDEYYALWYWCRFAFPSTPLIVGGLASGNPYRGEQYWSVESATAIAVHPYDKTAPAARLLLRQYRELAELPIWVTEWYRPAAEVRDFGRMLAAEAGAAWWFCWSDSMVAGHGLIDVSSGLKPEYHAMLEVLRMPELLFGFKDLADRLGHDVVGEPVEDEHYFPGGKTSLQQTTRGLLIYSKEGNLPLFLPAALPNP